MKRLLWLAGIILFALAAFALIYFTAGTSLPFIATAAAKVGLDFGFMAGLSTVAASAVAASIVTGATLLTFAAVKTVSWIAKGIFKLLCCCRSSSESDNGLNMAALNEEDVDTDLSTSKTLNGLGGKQPTDERAGEVKHTDSPLGTAPATTPVDESTHNQRLTMV